MPDVVLEGEGSVLTAAAETAAASELSEVEQYGHLDRGGLHGLCRLGNGESPRCGGVNAWSLSAVWIRSDCGLP